VPTIQLYPHPREKHWETMKPDKSIHKWCQQNQIPQTTFHYWKEKFSPKQLQKSSFAELNIKRGSAISLQAPGLYIRLGSDCDPSLRKQLFALFGEMAC
jgi:hypothetical protein